MLRFECGAHFVIWLQFINGVILLWTKLLYVKY